MTFFKDKKHIFQMIFFLEKEENHTAFERHESE